MRFAYLRDPLFLVALVTYFVNRWAIKPLVDGGFFHEHFNDLICIPFCVPIMLSLQRRIGLRPSDTPPQGHEILIPLVIWSWMFEVWLPGTAWFGQFCVADYRDVIYYAAGAAGSVVFWRYWYGESDDARVFRYSVTATSDA